MTRRRLVPLGLVALLGAAGLIVALAASMPRAPVHHENNYVVQRCGDNKPRTADTAHNTSSNRAANKSTAKLTEADQVEVASESEEKEAEKPRAPETNPDLPPLDYLLKPSWRAYTPRETFVQRVKLRVTLQDEFKYPVHGAEVVVSAYGVAHIADVPEEISVSPVIENYNAVVIGHTNSGGVVEVEIGFEADFEEFLFVALSVSASTVLAKADKVEVDWVRSKPDKLVEANLVLPQRGGVRGRVVDESGIGIKGIRVFAYWKEGFKNCQGEAVSTDDSGHFELTNLPLLTVALSVTGERVFSSSQVPRVTIYAHQFVHLAPDIIVIPYTQHSFTLKPPDKANKQERLNIRFLRDDEELRMQKVEWSEEYVVKLGNIPEGATAIVVMVPGCKPLRINLQDSTYLGEFIPSAED